MVSLRLGRFKPNWIGLGISATFLVFFIIYMVGFGQFDSAYRALYDADEYKAMKTMKWFLIGCPVVMLITSLLLFAVTSFESRHVLFGFSALLFLGGIGFVLISLWLIANLVYYNSDKGWESCKNKVLCGKLKTGLETFIAGAVFCALASFGQMVYCFVVARKLASREASYAGIQTNELSTLHDSDEHEAYFHNTKPDEEEISLDD